MFALVAVGLWMASSVIGADDPRREGEVIKVEERKDGSTDIYREQSDGEIVVEHQAADGEVWFESNEIVGHDGNPIICPNGDPLRIDFRTEVKPPSVEAARHAQRGLPDDKRAVYNEYTGEFEVIDAVTNSGPDGEVVLTEPLVYKCDPKNEATVVPLSDVDPQAAEESRRQMTHQIEKAKDLTGLGSSPPDAQPTQDRKTKRSP